MRWCAHGGTSRCCRPKLVPTFSPATNFRSSRAGVPNRERTPSAHNEAQFFGGSYVQQNCNARRRPSHQDGAARAECPPGARGRQEIFITVVHALLSHGGETRARCGG